MSLQIINPSYFSSIQDRGRFGFAHIGVTSSGVMDEFSYLALNMLLRNKNNENALEIVSSGFQARLLGCTQIAITGAYCNFYINDELKNVWQTYNLKAGDLIKIEKIKNGARVYLGVKNGFNIKKEFGSNSLTLKEKLGGLDGGFLKKDDILEFQEYRNYNTFRFKENFLPKYDESLELRVMLSYQSDYFSKESLDKFFSSQFYVTNEFNSMAYKLCGEKIICNKKEIISEAIAFGSIQIPNDGNPIILLKQRQTIGGYAKIGVVFAIDCFKLSQAKANTKITFKKISFEEASLKIKEFYSSFS